MRIVITSDTHFAFDPLPAGDLLIHAGDAMYSGGPEEWQSRVDSFGEQPHEQKIYVPGNHDFHVELYQGVATAELRRAANVTTLGVIPERAVIEIDGIRILGLPWVTGLPGWAYSRDELWVQDYMDEIVKMHGVPDIVVSHAPMFNFLDAIRPEEIEPRKQVHVGCLAYNRWFHASAKKPKYWINGHIHESYGQTKHEGTIFINACMCDRNYKQSNAPIIIEV